jgi:hypothetical protein
MGEVLRRDGSQIPEEGLKRRAPMITRRDCVVPVAFEGVQEDQGGVHVEVRDAKVRDGATRVGCGEAQPEFPRIAVGEDGVPTRSGPER